LRIPYITNKVLEYSKNDAEYSKMYRNIAPLIIVNKIIGGDSMDRPDGLAKRNSKLIKIGLEQRGTKVNFMGIPFYSDLSITEDIRSMPIAYSKPRHQFSRHIEDLVQRDLATTVLGVQK
jgi:hypothetical protein